MTVRISPRNLPPSNTRRRSRSLLKSLFASALVLAILAVTVFHYIWLTASRKEQRNDATTVIVAACMNRGDTLSIAVRTWLTVSDVSAIILLDWSSSPPLSNLIPELLMDNRIKLITIQDEEKWVLSWAYNLALTFISPGSNVVKVDCDTVLSPNFLEEHPMEDGIFYAGDYKLATTENSEHLNGVLYVSYSDFFAVNGYDERLQTYGYDDTNLYDRLNAYGLTMKPLDGRQIYHLDHPASLRLSKQSISHVLVETQKNRMLTERLPAWGRNSTRASFQFQRNPNRPEAFTGRRISSVLSLQSIISENETASMERTAAKIVLRDYDVPWSSLTFPVSYLIKMIYSYEQGRMLIIHVQHGLGNRLRAMAAGLVVSRETRRHFRLIWIPDEHCNARFEDLFLNKIDVWDEFHPAEVESDSFDRYNYMATEAGAHKGKNILTTSLNHIYVKTAYILNHPAAISSRIHEVLRELTPKPHIAAMVNAFDAETLIGMHIRSANPRQEIAGIRNDSYLPGDWEELTNARKAVKSTLFEAEIDNMLEKYPTQRFFLSADSTATIAHFKTRYNKQIETLDRQDCQDRSERCLSFSLADLLILSRTKEILGSPLSSFSEVAGLNGNITVKYAELHFPDPPSDHNTKEELVGRGNGMIYIAYSSAENGRRESESSWRTRELVRSAQSVQAANHGEAPIALFVDNRTYIPDEGANLFKSILFVNVNVLRTSSDGIIKNASYRIDDGKAAKLAIHLGKIQYLGRSPFAITLYLDSDTIMCDKIPELDKLLQGHDIMFSKVPHRKSDSQWAWHTGVILYRNSPIVQRFFQLWEQLYLQNCIFPQVSEQDTCALSSALQQSPLLKYGALDPVFNLRLTNENWADPNWQVQKLRSQLVRWPVKIFHSIRVTNYQSNETCRIINERRLSPRVVGVTPDKQFKMYYSKDACVNGTRDNCDLDPF